MALSISFFALAVTFTSIGISNMNKAKKMSDTTEAEAAEKKKMNNNGIAFLITGISFISIAIAFAIKNR